MSHQTTAWLRWRLGHAAVPSLAGITTLRQKGVRNSSSVAAGRTSTTILARMSATAPALAQVLDKGFYAGFFFIFHPFFSSFFCSTCPGEVIWKGTICFMMNISEGSVLLSALSLCSKSTRWHSLQFASSTIYAIVMLKLCHDGFILLVLIQFLFFVFFTTFTF